MKLLIATDLSPTSRTVIDAVKTRPWPLGTEARIVHVVDLSPFPMSGEILDVARDAAESLLKSVVQELAQSGLNAKAEVVLAGYPRTSITEYAKKWGANLIIVGSHGAGGLRRFVLGSVAQGVVRGAPCSVEIVRPAPASSAGKAGMRVLLATDGSDCANAAVKSVGSRPWPANSSIRLISVVKQFVPIPDMAAPYLNAELLAREAERLEREGHVKAKEAVAAAQSLLSEMGLQNVQIAEIPLGDPRALILGEAKDWNADLIVLGSHGWHGLDRVLMGSVSESVAMHAHCSVEIIR